MRRFKRIRGLRHGCWHLWRGTRHWTSGRCTRCHDRLMDGIR